MTTVGQASDTPVPVRDAATVVLLRDGDGPGGLETWLLTRVPQMVFAAGMSVFPGGRVDPADAGLPVAAADVTRVARRFGCPEPLATALLAAAVRETYEETGVLLTAPPARLPEARAAVESGELAFGDLLAQHGLTIDAAALRPWARWVTPEGEVRRYDTRFFVGALPPGDEPRDVTSESTTAEWLPITTALEQGERGERRLLPPTATTLREVAAHASVVEALAAADERVIDPVQPVLAVAADGAVTVTLPDGTVHTVPRAVPR